MAEEALISLFGVLLVLGAVLLLFAPLSVRLYRSGSWLLLLLLLLPAFLLASVGVDFVRQSFVNPLILSPLVAFVFVAKVLAPSMTFYRLRGRLLSRHLWGKTKPLAFLGFVSIGIYVAYRAFVPAPPAEAPVLLTERLVIALGTAFLFLRLYWKVLPKGSPGWVMLWAGAILFSLAFAVIAPYAFPEYAALYGVAGVMGWLIGAAIILRSPTPGSTPPWPHPHSA